MPLKHAKERFRWRIVFFCETFTGPHYFTISYIQIQRLMHKTSTSGLKCFSLCAQANENTDKLERSKLKINIMKRLTASPVMQDMQAIIHLCSALVWCLRRNFGIAIYFFGLSVDDQVNYILYLLCRQASKTVLCCWVEHNKTFSSTLSVPSCSRAADRNFVS